MKNIIYIAWVLFCSPVMSSESEGVTGIWDTQVGYFSVHENNGIVVAIRLDDDRSSWDALSGERNGDTIRLETLISGVNVVVNVTLKSENTFTAVQESCAPAEKDSICLLPNGVAFEGNKIW